MKQVLASWKTQQGFIFSSLYVCVPFNFFIPQAELRQPQIKVVHTVWHLMIKSYSPALEMDR